MGDRGPEWLEVNQELEILADAVEAILDVVQTGRAPTDPAMQRLNNVWNEVQQVKRSAAGRRRMMET